MIQQLKWWFIFCSSLVGAFIAFKLGYMQKLWEVDISKLSYVTLATYTLVSLYVGFLTWKASLHGSDHSMNYDVKTRRADVVQHIPALWFASELMMGLGMMGTIIGFLFMLNNTFAGVAPGTAVVTSQIVASAAIGLSTSCTTTLVGLVCSFLTKMQLVNLEYLFDEVK